MKRRFYRKVPANTVEVDEYIIPLGELIEIQKFIGNSSVSPQTAVEIYWKYNDPGEELLFCTHADSVQDVNDLKLPGNGIDKIAIVLRNDQGNEDTLGGYWEGDDIGDN